MHKIIQVKQQEEQRGKVYQSHPKALLEIAPYGIKIIREQKYGLSAYHTAKNIRGTYVLPAECNGKEQKADGNADVAGGVLENGNMELCTEQIQQQRGSGGRLNQVCAVELRKNDLIFNRRFFKSEIQIQCDENGNNHGEHHQIEGKQLPKFSAEQFKIPL